EFGAFAVAFSILLFFSGPHTALLADPINVVGPRHFGRRTVSYLRAVVALHAALTIPLGLLVAGAQLLPIRVEILPAPWLMALGLATPFVPALWLLRGACYLENRPGVALGGSVVYTAALFLLLALTHSRNWLTGPLGLTVMAGASLIGSIAIAGALGILRGPLPTSEIGNVVREHWRYGRWILGASIANGVGTGLYAPLFGALLGLDQTAALRVLQTLILPFQQVLTAIALVAYPSMSRKVVEIGPGYLLGRGPVFVGGGVGLAAIYGIIISVVSVPLFSLMYEPGGYTAYAGLTSLVALVATVAALAQFLGILVRVVDQPRAVFWSKLFAALWLTGVGVVLIRASGVRGALLSLAGGSAVEAAVLALVLLRTV